MQFKHGTIQYKKSLTGRQLSNMRLGHIFNYMLWGVAEIPSERGF